jgi:haloalkane dehalogenase
MRVLRTPDERFAGLPGYDFAPHYVEVGEIDGHPLRMHYVDEGPRDADAVLLMHGEPSWSYLYRAMIPVITAAGLRAIAPDLIGFGRSDKPAERSDYTYARHVEWVRALVEALDLRDATLVGQDWGGLIGLRVVAENTGRFARVVAANTGLPTGDQKLGKAFHAWRTYSQEAPEFPIGKIVSGGCTTKPLEQAVIDAYDAPFPDDRYKAGARQFPVLVPASPDDPAAEANRAAWDTFSRWEKPFLTAFSDDDPITRGADRLMRDRIPGARGVEHVTIHNAGHFLQEDKAVELAEAIVRFALATGARTA